MNTIAEVATKPVNATSSISDLDTLVKTTRKLGSIRVAVAHPCDEISLQGAIDAQKEGLIKPFFIAPLARLKAVATSIGVDLADMEIKDVPHSHAAAACGAKLASEHRVDALMKGSLHSDELMAAVLASAPLCTERRVSHCYLMESPFYSRLLLITDAAVNIAPNLAEKADILRNAIDLAHIVGLARPRIAILAAVETVNPKMQATIDAAALCKMADRGQIIGAELDGPLAFDNAISKNAARIKEITSSVAGRADVLLVPNIESGNMLAKQIEYLGEAKSAAIVMGSRIPVILTSRADSRATRIASAALAVLVSLHERGKGKVRPAQ